MNYYRGDQDLGTTRGKGFKSKRLPHKSQNHAVRSGGLKKKNVQPKGRTGQGVCTIRERHLTGLGRYGTHLGNLTPGN